MKILLDENFPLPLYHRLRAAGYEADHIVILGQRGLPDTAIRQRLLDEDLVFLTQDTEFEDLPPNTRGVVIISRVPQSLPIRQRVEIWLAALGGFMVHRPPGKLFDLLEDGTLVAWRTRSTDGNAE